MSESDGEPLQTLKVYDEDEEVEVKYEPLDSELIRESEILGYDSGCVTCQKVIKKITVHLTDHVGSSSNDVDRLTEPQEYIVDPNYIIKIEPGDVGIMNDTQRPGSHDSRNSGQRQWKVLDFDTGQCSPDCEICKKYLRELREHLAINHPQLQFQPGCAVAPLPQRSTVLGPLKTVDFASPEAHRFQNFQLFREPAGEKNTHSSKDAKIKKRTTQTSKRAGYPEEAIAIQASSSKPVKKKSRPSSNRSGQNQNTVFNPTAKKRRTRRANDVNSDSESKSKESESEGRSSNEIHTEVESSELNPTSAVTLGENGESSDSHEINLTDHMSHTGGNQDITHTGNVFIEMSKTAVEGESVMTIHGGRQPEMDRSGQEIYQQTDTGEKQSVIVPVGGRYGEMSRIPEKVGHNKEEPTNLGQIMSEPAKSVDPAGELPNLTHTVDKPSMTTRGVEIPARLTHSGGNWNPRRMLEIQIRKRLKPSESESTSTTSLDNFYNCKKCRKVFSTRSNLLYHHNVVHSDERFECSECGQSFVSRSTLTLHEKIHMVRNKVLAENGGKEMTGQVFDDDGNSTPNSYTSGEPVTKTLGIGNPTSGICIDHEEVESLETAHIGDNPARVTTIRGNPENEDRTAMASGKSTNMDPAGEIYTCEYCGRGFKTEYGLDVHKRVRMPYYLLKCYKCTMRFQTQSDLITHVLTHGGEKLLGCDVCRMRFRFLANWITHMVTHSGQKPFRCEICEETFKTPDELDTHIVNHNAEKQKTHKCDSCRRTFDRLALLTDHKVIHSEEPFKCYKCGQRYKILDDLMHHIEGHGEWKPYSCDVCEESFKSSQAVISHMKIHTEERPFKCETCGRNFKTSDQLTVHMEVHNRQVWRKCHICKETFETNSLWSAHLPNHNKYTCKICKETFTTLSLWTKHQENHNAFK